MLKMNEALIEALEMHTQTLQQVNENCERKQCTRIFTKVRESVMTAIELAEVIGHDGMSVSLCAYQSALLTMAGALIVNTAGALGNLVKTMN